MLIYFINLKLKKKMSIHNKPILLKMSQIFNLQLSLILYFFIPHFMSLNIDLIKNNHTYIVYSNNTLDYHFIYNKEEDISDCSPKMIYYEKEDRNHTIFTFRFIDNKTNNIADNEDNVSVQDQTVLTSTNDRIKTNLAIIRLNESLVLDIEHYCIEDDKTDNSNNKNYWGVIQLEFYSKEMEEEGIKDKIKLEFVKFCKPPDLMGSIITAILLFAMATLFVIISTYSEMSLELTEIKQHGELKYWHGIVFIISGSIVLILIFYFLKYINIIFTMLISFQISLALYLTIKTLYEYVGLHKNSKLIFLNKQIKFCKNKLKIEIEMYSFILMVFTSIMVISYLFTKHWILNNIFGFALVFTILSLFHIRSFKTCAILLFSAFMYDVFWVYISPFIFTQNVMVVAATSLNMPIKLEMPIFFDNHPLKSCMFLGLGDLVLPGFVLKFCHRFDFIKKTTVYYKTSIFLYVVALSMSGIVIAFFNSPQPVLFYMCPVILGGIMMTAYSRKELDIWNANLLEDNLQYVHTVERGGSDGHNIIPQSSYINSDNFSELENRSNMSFTTEPSDSNSDDANIL